MKMQAEMEVMLAESWDMLRRGTEQMSSESEWDSAGPLQEANSKFKLDLDEDMGLEDQVPCCCQGGGSNTCCYGLDPESWQFKRGIGCNGIRETGQGMLRIAGAAIHNVLGSNLWPPQLQHIASSSFLISVFFWA